VPPATLRNTQGSGGRHQLYRYFAPRLHADHGHATQAKGDYVYVSFRIQFQLTTTVDSFYLRGLTLPVPCIKRSCQGAFFSAVAAVNAGAPSFLSGRTMLGPFAPSGQRRAKLRDAGSIVGIFDVAELDCG